MIGKRSSTADAEIVMGVRYKKGSVKVLRLGEVYIVETKRYFLFKIPIFRKRTACKTLADAENEYGRISSYFYRIS